MSDLSDTALAFCLECSGWSSADTFTMGRAFTAVRNLSPGESAGEVLNASDLGQVLKAVKRWLSDNEYLGFQLRLTRRGEYIAMIVDEAFLPVQILAGEDDTYPNPCLALLKACLLAHRKRKVAQCNS